MIAELEDAIKSGSAGLKWPTVSAILRSRFAHHTIPDHELDRSKADYLTLSQATALGSPRFWQVRVGGTIGAC
jgi:hypothetical protein